MTPPEIYLISNPFLLDDVRDDVEVLSFGLDDSCCLVSRNSGSSRKRSLETVEGLVGCRTDAVIGGKWRQKNEETKEEVSSDLVGLVRRRRERLTVHRSFPLFFKENRRRVSAAVFSHHNELQTCELTSTTSDILRLKQHDLLPLPFRTWPSEIVGERTSHHPSSNDHDVGFLGQRNILVDKEE